MLFDSYKNVMSFSPQIRYLLLNVAVLTACAIESVRGYPWLVILLGALTFFFIGNLVLYLSGSKERAVRRQQKRKYWAGQA